jgi:hypothetical protein
MNQVADSWKKNLQPIVAKSLIYLQGWHLSHILHHGESEKRFNLPAKDSKKTHCAPFAR